MLSLKYDPTTGMKRVKSPGMLQYLKQGLRHRKSPKLLSISQFMVALVLKQLEKPKQRFEIIIK